MRAGNAGNSGTFPRWWIKTKYNAWQLHCCKIGAGSHQKGKMAITNLIQIE